METVFDFGLTADPTANPSMNTVWQSEQIQAQVAQLQQVLLSYGKQLSAINQSEFPDHLPVLPQLLPAELLANLPTEFPKEGISSATLGQLWQRVVDEANHLHHPGYVGHQVSSPLPVAVLCETLSAALNNGSAIFEMGPLNTAMERRVTQWMAQQLGWSSQLAGGVLTSGGSLGNLTALLVARQQQAEGDVWKNGQAGLKPMTVLVSEQAHYCVQRAVQILGWGEAGVSLVPTDEQYALDATALEACYQNALAEGRQVIAVVGSACSTATGSFDPLDKIADFCQAKGLWFHVDGAHGASVCLSPKYRHLLAGVERADSVVWDAHKMMLVPALNTAVLFRDFRHSAEAFAQKASYLYDSEQLDDSQAMHWENLGLRTFECTKRMMGMILYVTLQAYGTDFFATYLTHMIDLTRWFADFLAAQPDFELAVQPACNIICFRYRPVGAVGDQEALNALQAKIRAQVLASEQFYIVQTQLRGKTYLRCTLINPKTEQTHLQRLVSLIRTLA